ncbi:MAG: fused ferrous iron transport protein A/B, partial [Sphaerochaetaceae bacterium]|nr:fused ferrous iron transport protein A/B [Sphaerochaetaceae bacterium]
MANSTLNTLEVGENCIIEKVGGNGALRQHFLDMGLIPGTELSVVKFAPMGDPMEIRVHGYELTLRLDDAKQIEVSKYSGLKEKKIEKKGQSKKYLHPHLGEPGIHHDKTTEKPLPDNHVLSFALVGNQNCGKTTLFNRLTGSNQHVGNFPGVTVDRKDGTILGHPNTSITDLPGIYSMSPYSSEEIVSRDFILKSDIDAIINIIDATNMERNLYLTMQLLEINKPMVVAINMMDELSGNGGAIFVNRMEELLGVPVVPISASKNQGIEELVTHALHVAKYQERPLYQDFCSKEDYGGAVHRCLHSVVHLIEDHAEEKNLPIRFAASKAIEGDSLVLEQLALDQNELETLEHITIQMEKERNLDRFASIADMRFSFIGKVCQECVIKPRESKERLRSEKIDKVLTGKYTAIPVFLLIMVLVFILTFNVIGAFFQGLLENGINSLILLLDRALTSGNVNYVIHDLIINGICKGVGSVLSFMPIVVTMFFFLSIL